MDQLLDDIARKSTYYSKIVDPSRDNQLEYTAFCAYYLSILPELEGIGRFRVGMRIY